MAWARSVDFGAIDSRLRWGLGGSKVAARLRLQHRCGERHDYEKAHPEGPHQGFFNFMIAPSLVRLVAPQMLERNQARLGLERFAIWIPGAELQRTFLCMANTDGNIQFAATDMLPEGLSTKAS